jgi:hypothetical protein
MEGEMEGDLKRRFRNHVFCLLTRYAALAGGTDRGGGMQGVRQRRLKRSVSSAVSLEDEDRQWIWTVLTPALGVWGSVQWRWEILLTRRDLTRAYVYFVSSQTLARR